MPESAAQALDALRRRIACRGAARSPTPASSSRTSGTRSPSTTGSPPTRAVALAAIGALLGELAPSLGRFGGKYVVNVVASGMPD